MKHSGQWPIFFKFYRLFGYWSHKSNELLMGHLRVTWLGYIMDNSTGCLTGWLKGHLTGHIAGCLTSRHLMGHHSESLPVALWSERWCTSLGAQCLIPGISCSESAIKRGKTQMMLLPPFKFSLLNHIIKSDICCCFKLLVNHLWLH